jgi:GrpB-like predicted nucleotidyltransferase (UPF0157 family)
VPFPDETFAQGVAVLEYQESWATEGAALAERLHRLIPGAAAVDHIGSTPVPGMPAKDCIDAMVRVSYSKLVFAAPEGGRAVNIHVREVGSATARYALLFRDYLRADMNSREVWAQFKVRLAETSTDLFSYGQIKSSAQPLLMALAEHWAESHEWRPC